MIVFFNLFSLFIICGACMPLFFFFEDSGFTFDLHSFPTRRSSDLGAKHFPGRYGHSGAGAIAYADACHAAKVLLLGDRKSTRLNSSHVASSYAVFCLKKKNSQSKIT